MPCTGKSLNNLLTTHSLSLHLSPSVCVFAMRRKGRVQIWRKRRKVEDSRRVRNGSARGKLEQLRKKIPGCSGQLAADSNALFNAIADYISFLELKASLLRAAISYFPHVSKSNRLN